jgi:hypothetical protein
MGRAHLSAPCSFRPRASDVNRRAAHLAIAPPTISPVQPDREHCLSPILISRMEVDEGKSPFTSSLTLSPPPLLCSLLPTSSSPSPTTITPSHHRPSWPKGPLSTLLPLAIGCNLSRGLLKPGNGVSTTVVFLCGLP